MNDSQQPALAAHPSSIDSIDRPQVNTPSVDLHIDELVLHGFAQGAPAGYRAQIGAAVEQELGRLLAEQGVPAGLYQDGAVARLDGGAFQMTTDAQVEAIGIQVAQAIYRGLGR